MSDSSARIATGINGRACLTADGRLKLCSCSICPQCVSGTGEITPAMATVDSVTTGSGCIPATKANDGTDITESIQTSVDVNGSFSIALGTVSSIRCLWNTAALPGTVEIYPNDSCFLFPSDGTGYEYSLFKIDGFWKFVIGSPQATEGGGVEGQNYAWFIGTIPTVAGTDCDETLTFTNDLTSLSGAYNDPYFGWVIPVGTGGTVTVTF